MKYHTSPATVIISILILLVFVSVSAFCVFSLRIGSPSLMILNQIESLYESNPSFDLTFESVDRNMANGITINRSEINTASGIKAEIDKIVIYQNPLEIIKQLLFGKGRFEIDIKGVDAFIPKSLFGSGSGEAASSDISADRINGIVSSLESYSYLFEENLFYDFSYSINVEELSVEVEDIIDISDMKLNLSLKPEFVFDSFRFSLPEASYKNSDFTAYVSDFNFIGALDDSYSMNLSISSASVSSEAMNIALKDFAAGLDFDSFYDLDITNLPLSFSFSSLKGSYDGYELNIGRSGGRVGGNTLSGTVLATEVNAEGFRIGIPTALFNLSRGDSSTFDLELIFNSIVSVSRNGSRLAEIRGTSFSLSAGSTLSASISADRISAGNLEVYTDSLISASSLDNIHLSYSLVEGESAVEGSAVLSASSENRFFSGAAADIAFSAASSAGEIENADILFSNVAFPLLDSAFEISASYRDSAYSASLRYSDELNLTASGTADDIDVDLSFFGFPVFSFVPLIEEYVPVLRNYIAEDTSVSGSLSLNLDQIRELEGSVIGSLAVSSISFNDMSFGLATRIDASVEDGLIDVAALSLTSEIIRATYSGSISLDTFFPEGAFALEMTESGKRLLDVSFSLNQAKEYSFDARIPDFESSYFRGSVNWARENVIISEGDLKSGDTEYPFDLTIDLANYRLDMISSGLIVSLDYEEKLDLLVDFDSFKLPSVKNSGDSAVVDGTISYYFGFAEQIIEAEALNFTISNITRIASHPTLSLDFTYDNAGFRADNIKLTDSFGTLDGSAVYNRSSSAFAFTLGSQSEGRVNLSIIRDQGGYSGILSCSEASLDRFGLESTALTTRLVGWGSSLSDFSFSGSLSAYPSTGEGSFSFNADVILDAVSLRLQNISYSTDTLTASSPMLFVNMSDGHFAGDVNIAFEKENRDRSYPVTASMSLSLELGSHNSMIDMVFSLPQLIRNSLSAQIEIDSLVIDNLYRIDDKIINADFSTARLLLDGNFINGSYDFESGDIDISISDNEIVEAEISGNFNMDLFDLDISNVKYDLGVMNFLYPVPVVTFEKGSYVYGDFILYGNFEDSHLYGQAYSHGFDMNIWWMDEEYLRVGDVYAFVVDNHATTNKTSVMMIDRTTGEINRGYAVTEAQLSNANLLDFYNIALEIPDGNNVHIWAPVQSQNMQIKADVSGSFNLYSDLRKNYLSGDLVLDNAVMSIGMDTLPLWFESRMAVNNNFNVILRNRCSFVMPLGTDPIISAYFEENTAFDFSYDSQDRSIALNGTLGFRSGEIYYFEKNFYITEGNLAFTQGSSSRLDPLINLRARLRDFDSSGNKVDIYLVLNNSSLSNISPSFESSPQKDISEIMSILGEAILPSSAYGDFSLGSVASLVTSGLDVMSRVGLLGSSEPSTSNLSNVIRSSLGLDMFSMRSSILRNLIIDNIFYTSSEEFSPMARYLNDTNIYLGKYLSRNFFLQGLIHLESVKDSERSFLASDLELDVEISLEWQTPLGEITFATSPTNLSLYNIFDSFALSYSNRIRF